MLVSPTASQNDFVVQDTPLRLPPEPGTVCVFQDDPFHLKAASGATASQNVAVAQETALTPLVPGTVCKLHDVPFHFSANVALCDGLPPAASQKVADTHETPVSSADVLKPPDGFGVGCRLHEVPFQLAARVRVSPRLSW